MSEFLITVRPMPGSIMADGSIVTNLPWVGREFRIVNSGYVWIDRKRLDMAKRFGWSFIDGSGHRVLVKR